MLREVSIMKDKMFFIIGVFSIIFIVLIAVMHCVKNKKRELDSKNSATNEIDTYSKNEVYDYVNKDAESVIKTKVNAGESINNRHKEIEEALKNIRPKNNSKPKDNSSMLEELFDEANNI